MADLMTLRRRIMLNAPQEKTATGTDVVFRTDIPANLTECKLYFDFLQSGSGTPSPQNVRPISGWKDFSVYHSGENKQDADTYSFSFSGTRYGGFFSLPGNGNNALVYTDRTIVTLSGDDGWNAVGSKFYINIRDTNFQNSTSKDAQICNMYPFDKIDSNGSAGVTKDKHFYLQRTSTLDWCRVWVYDTSYDLAGFKALLNATPLRVTLPIVPYWSGITKTNIKAKTGVNHIWNSNGGNMEVKYLSTH